MSEKKMSKKCKILFDLYRCQPLQGHKFHGGGEYIKSVFAHLTSIYETDCQISVFYNPALFIDDFIKEIIQKKSLIVYAIQNEKDIQIILNKGLFDVFYSGLPNTYGKLKIPHKTHFCGTIHGLRTIELPVDYYASKYVSGFHSIKLQIKNFFRNYFMHRQISVYEQCIKNLDSLILVSEHTRFAIKNFFPNLKKPIHTFYTPPKNITTKDIQEEKSLGKYILLVSCDRFEKNAYRALVALENLFSKKILTDYKVVCTGFLPFKISKIIHNSDKYIQLGYVSPEKLESLYAGCDFFLYPTLNEGFGMPPLEAMKYGKTCVVSGVCSLPEVCGDAVYYCNPYDISEMQNRILMASEKKIDKEKIQAHLLQINAKQNADLDRLCKYLLNIEKKDV